MDTKIITTIDHFKPWGNAVNVLEKLEKMSKLQDLDFYLSELYPNGIEGDKFNDLIGIDHDELFQQMGIYNDIYDGEDDVYEESLDFKSLNKTIKKAITEFYDVEGMDSVEMDIVAFGDGRYELDGIEFYLGEDETLENAVDTCIEMEFLPEWEEQGLSSYNVDSVQFDEEAGEGKAYIGLFWDEDLEESLNEESGKFEEGQKVKVDFNHIGVNPHIKTGTIIKKRRVMGGSGGDAGYEYLIKTEDGNECWTSGVLEVIK